MIGNKRTKPKRATEVDFMIGQNLRLRRLAKGMTQFQLAHALGITFQQVQKYENSTNRISSGRLPRIAEALSCHIMDLFEGVPGVDKNPQSELTPANEHTGKKESRT